MYIIVAVEFFLNSTNFELRAMGVVSVVVTCTWWHCNY